MASVLSIRCPKTIQIPSLETSTAVAWLQKVLDMRHFDRSTVGDIGYPNGLSECSQGPTRDRVE